MKEISSSLKHPGKNLVLQISIVLVVARNFQNVLVNLEFIHRFVQKETVDKA